MNALIKNNFRTRSILRKHCDFMEDVDCLRIGKPKEAEANIMKEIMKLVPLNYKISMLPAFFNNTDADRIGTVIRDTSSEFLIDTPKKVMFSIAVKVFPYNHNINSVRIVLAKFHSFDAGTVEKNEKPEKGKEEEKGEKEVELIEKKKGVNILDMSEEEKAP